MSLISKVYPAHANAMNVKHPSHGALRDDGEPVEWEKDGFWARMITDGTITTDPAKAWKTDRKQDTNKLPPHAARSEEEEKTRLEEIAADEKAAAEKRDTEDKQVDKMLGENAPATEKPLPPKQKTV
jgi:hypothetical protein